VTPANDRPDRPDAALHAAPGSGSRYLEVLAPGLLATIQDRGRPGRGELAVSPSGAADRGAAALANRLVGNRAGAAGIEATLGGLVARAGADLVVAVAGAPVGVEVDDRPMGMHATLHVPAGAVIALGTPERGLRSYLAVRGGIDVAPVLGSRSFDVLSAIGPPPLRAGDRLPVGRPRGQLPAIDVAPVPAFVAGDVVVTCTPGPRADWLTPGASAALTATRWQVASESNRIAVRLDGPPLARRDDRELASEGLVRGAIQVPASGRPLIFLADHPTTGGYPVVAVVDDAASDAVAQLRPGQGVVLQVRPRARPAPYP
jgi:biotin-dependent carboxylase-like uncharacterized protein